MNLLSAFVSKITENRIYLTLTWIIILIIKLCLFQHLVNSEIYLAGREIEESLMRRDVSKCLAWFNENKTKLKKNGVRFFL